MAWWIFHIEATKDTLLVDYLQANQLRIVDLRFKILIGHNPSCDILTTLLEFICRMRVHLVLIELVKANL